jgi:glycosyltransferase involved in cell wall biosynthesis
MEEPLISIIVPVYQVKPYLEKCVSSICRQTYSNLEILLIDDGSWDGSQDLCDSLAILDSRIRVIHQPNAGSSAARNRGLSLAKGQYIGFVDSDDFIEPNMYQSLYEALIQFHAKAAQTGRLEWAADGSRLPDICIPPLEPTVVSAESFLKELLMHRGDSSFCTKLFAREILEGKKFPEGVLNEDFRLLVQLLEELPVLVSLPEQCYHVLYREESNTRSRDKEKFSTVFADCIDNADWVMSLVEVNYPNLKKEAFRFGVFQRIEYLLHIPIQQMTEKNQKYRNIVNWLRIHFWEALGNPWLTGKNKLYLALFVFAPKGIRLLHRTIRSIR